MAPRSLFNLILKVIGLFFIRDVLEACSHTLSALVYFPQYASSKEALVNVAATLPPLVLYALLVWLFIFRSDAIINFFKLEKNVSSGTISFNADRSTLLSAAVVIAGVWVLVHEIPEFIRQGVYYYQERKMYVRMTRPDVSYLVMSLVKIVIGLFMVVFHKPIVRLIEWGGSKTSPRRA